MAGEKLHKSWREAFEEGCAAFGRIVIMPGCVSRDKIVVKQIMRELCDTHYLVQECGRHVAQQTTKNSEMLNWAVCGWRKTHACYSQICVELWSVCDGLV